jgi:hypothetical protein
MITGFLTSEFVPPFAAAKKRSLSAYMRQAGIYLIKENDIIVYVGMSKSCVVKACYRHFERWNDSRGIPRMTYKEFLETYSYSVLIIPVCAHQVEGFERALIVALKPRDNKNKLEQINEPALVAQEEDDVPF